MKQLKKKKYKKKKKKQIDLAVLETLPQVPSEENLGILEEEIRYETDLDNDGLKAAIGTDQLESMEMGYFPLDDINFAGTDEVQVNIDASENDLSLPAYRVQHGQRIKPVQMIIPSVCIIVILISLLGILNGTRLTSSPSAGSVTQKVVPTQITERNSNPINPELTVESQLAPFFEQSVLYWEVDIVRWADRHNMDPNMVATIMQIESCGDPQAVSRSGAMGLFQVMPFHFETGEDGFDPEINSLRGMNYLAERLIQTNGEIGHAFAGYNGGHVASGTTWSNWADETKRYYRWTTGVYQEAVSGSENSETLEQWLAAGGSSLCAGARQKLGLG